MLDLAGNGAVLSDCEKYRYRLERHVGWRGPVHAFFGINPSTADASIDDATVRKWRGFCDRLMARRFVVGNVFAYRSTDVKQLASVSDPEGPDNSYHLGRIIAEADILVPCWGDSGKVPPSLRPTISKALGLLRGSGKPVKCWGITKVGDPKHPLMLAYDTPLVDFT